MNAITAKGIRKTFTYHESRPMSVLQHLGALFTGGAKVKHHALQRIGLTVRQGESIGIIGNNGSGKTTLIRILLGIYEPTAGTLSVTGKVTGVTALGTGLEEEQTGRENVYLYGILLGMSKKGIKKNYKEIMRFAGLTRQQHVPVKKYSSGMKSRLALSVALHASPDIFIIDEVLSVGDHEFQRRILAHLDKMRAKGMTCIIASHDLELIRNHTDRALLLDDGKAVAEGEPGAVINRYLNGRG